MEEARKTRHFIRDEHTYLEEEMGVQRVEKRRKNITTMRRTLDKDSVATEPREPISQRERLDRLRPQPTIIPLSPSEPRSPPFWMDNGLPKVARREPEA